MRVGSSEITKTPAGRGRTFTVSKPSKGAAMDLPELVSFVRARGLAVVATRSAAGHPQAALVGIAATDEGELVFDTSVRSRKYHNICADGRLAVVIGWDDEVTIQCEGTADLPTDEDRERCLAAYFDQYPDGRERAQDLDIVHVRITPEWVRYCDYRPDTFEVTETHLGSRTWRPDWSAP